MQLLFRYFVRYFVLSAFFLASTLSFAQKEAEEDVLKSEGLVDLKWQHGPATGKIDDKAAIQFDKNFVFLNENDTADFLEMSGNLREDGNFLFAPRSLKWAVFFSFEETGYVKDDEKIDADELLKTLRSNEKEANAQRKQLGLSALFNDGWQVLPHYDSASKHLEWGIRLRDGEGNKNANYTVRLLGRKGVMSAVLVSDLENLDQNVAEFKTALAGYDFTSGERYAEFSKGDKVAEYGLAALIVGGAAAVATKKGFWGAIGAFFAGFAKFFAAFWKLIAGAFIAIIAGVRAMFKKKE